MKKASENHFRTGEVGQSITVKIPDVDGTHSEFRYIIEIPLQIYYLLLINQNITIKMYF